MSSSDRCQLILPSADTPWDVQVVSVAPKRVEEELSRTTSGEPLGAVTEAWTTVSINKKIYVWPLAASMQQPKTVHTLFHSRSATASSTLLTMTATNATSNDIVYVHDATADGHVYLWKLSRSERPSAVARPPQARVKLVMEPGERVTALSSQGHVLVVGTSLNSLWWCTATSHPIELQAQKVERQQGFFRRMFSTSYSAASAAAQPIHSILILNDKVFFSITENAQVEEYKVTTTIAASHKATFEGTAVTSLQTALREKTRMAVRELQVMRTCLHQRSIDFVLRINNERIYWVRLHIDQDSTPHLVQVKWLNRFHSHVQCKGLVATQNHVTYAAFQYEEGPVTFLAFSSGISEVDLPLAQVPKWIDGTLGKDFVTHGTWGLATSGLGIRTRFREGASQEALPSSQVTAETATLARHLRMAFWQWYPHGGSIQFPPSIQTASTPQQLEPAILTTARHLQTDSSKTNPAECHVAFLKLLWEGGLYRSISARGKWVLLGIGQELAVYQELHGRLPGIMQPNTVSLALQNSQDSTVEWSSNLCLALETAHEYRLQHAKDRYDVLPDQIPLHEIWTTQDTLQAVMRRELKLWDESPQVPATAIVVVTTALQSHMESSEPSVYDQVKAVAIPLVRKMGNDSLAFELSKMFSWNDGLCQLNHDHEKNAEFSLDILLKDPAFCQYAMKWNADRGLYHNVLNFGRHCPDLLAQFLETDDRLRPYRWIAAVRAQNYEGAASFLLDLEGGTLAETRRALSIAKTCSRKRRKLIDRKLELVKAQEMLLGDTETSLWTPERLLSVALDTLERAEDKIQTAVIALAIAGASDDRLRMSAQVWTACITVDLDRWTEWLNTQDDLSDEQLRETILNTTVFGGLWEEVKGQHEEDVCYGQALESLVLERLGFDVLQSMGMRRLLHMVTTPTAV